MLYQLQFQGKTCIEHIMIFEPHYDWNKWPVGECIGPLIKIQIDLINSDLYSVRILKIQI